MAEIEIGWQAQPGPSFWPFCLSYGHSTARLWAVGSAVPASFVLVGPFMVEEIWIKIVPSIYLKLVQPLESPESLLALVLILPQLSLQLPSCCVCVSSRKCTKLDMPIPLEPACALCSSLPLNAYWIWIVFIKKTTFSIGELGFVWEKKTETDGKSLTIDIVKTFVWKRVNISLWLCALHIFVVYLRLFFMTVYCTVHPVLCHEVFSSLPVHQCFVHQVHKPCSPVNRKVTDK